MNKHTIIHTPGHNIFVDSLIMYSLTSLANELIVEVEGLGEAYKLKFNSDIPSIAKTIASNLPDTDVILSKLIGINAIQKQKSVIKKVKVSLESLNDRERIERYLNDLLKPYHSLRANECRRSVGKGVYDTVYLAFSPYYGKYLTRMFGYDTTPYVACDMCRAFMFFGITKAHVMSLREQRKNTILIAIPIFIGKIGKDTINSLIQEQDAWKESMYSKTLSRVLDRVNNRIIPYLVLIGFRIKTIEEITKSKSSWSILTVKFEYRNMRQEIRGFNISNIDTFIDSLSRLANERLREGDERKILSGYDKIRQIVLRLVELIRIDRVSSDSVEALNHLITLLSERDVESVYKFIRVYEVLFRKSRELKYGVESLGANISKILLRLVLD